jgi:hypothetical protein
MGAAITGTPVTCGGSYETPKPCFCSLLLLLLTAIQPGKPGRLMGIKAASRLDLVMGASKPADKLPSRDVLQRLAPGVLTRTEEVLAR